jgi:predicted MFS family arabinose efflux permease
VAEVHRLQAVGSRRHRRAFWLVAFVFLVVMALGTVPSPLYGLYRERDGFSLFMVSHLRAVYAVGVIAALLLAGHLSDLYGRRRLLLISLGVAIASAVILAVSDGRSATATAVEEPLETAAKRGFRLPRNSLDMELASTWSPRPARTA